MVALLPESAPKFAKKWSHLGPHLGPYLGAVLEAILEAKTRYTNEAALKQRAIRTARLANKAIFKESETQSRQHTHTIR